MIWLWILLPIMIVSVLPSLFILLFISVAVFMHQVVHQDTQPIMPNTSRVITIGDYV